MGSGVLPSCALFLNFTLRLTVSKAGREQAGAGIFPPALTGADKGINPERAIQAAKDATQ